MVLDIVLEAVVLEDIEVVILKDPEDLEVQVVQKLLMQFALQRNIP